MFGSGKPSQEELDSFVTDTVLPSTQEQIDQIRALGFPEGDEDQINEILDSAESDVEAAQSDPSVLTQGGDPFADTNQLATDYGLTECAN